MKTSQDAVLKMIEVIGDDPSRDGLQETPYRVVKSWSKLFEGYRQNPSSVLKTFRDKCDEMIVLKDIEFYSTCEHHMLPFFGKAHVGYVPAGRVVGISKLVRLLEIFSRRLQIQERIGEQVTDALMNNLKPKGAAIVIEARHFCMLARGVEKQNSVMVTSSMTGVFRKDAKARAEFYQLIGK